MKSPFIKMMIFLVLLYVSFSHADIASPGYQPIQVHAKITNLNKFPIILAIARFDNDELVCGELVDPNLYVPSCYGAKLFWVSKSYFKTVGRSFVSSNEMKKHFIKWGRVSVEAIDTTIVSPINLLLNDANVLHGKVIMASSTKVKYLERFFYLAKYGDTYSIYRLSQIWHMKNGTVHVQKLAPKIEQNDMNERRHSIAEFYTEGYIDSLK